MTQTQSLFFACLLLASAPCMALESDTPLAVTTQAHAFFRPTPTDEQSALSSKYLQSGLDFLHDGQPRRAVQDFNDSVRLAPDSENFKALGTAYYQAGNNLKAVWAYRESLRLQPDPKVQALVDSLEDKEASGAQARYRPLLERAGSEAKAGDVDQAIQDYRDAYDIQPGLESAGPGLRLAADAAEGYLKRAALDKALEVLCQADAFRGASGLDADAVGDRMRLDKAAVRAERWSGMSLRDNQKAMLADHDAWVRMVRDKASAGEPGR